MEEQEQATAEDTAELKKQVEFAGSGCAIQGLALLCPFIGAIFGPVGIVIGLAAGIWLFVSGSNSAKKYRCGRCGNPVVDGNVSMCPTCKAKFTAAGTQQYHV